MKKSLQPFGLYANAITRAARYFFSTLVVFILCNPCQNIFAQNKIIDSLLTVLQRDGEDSLKINHLNSLSREFINIGSYDTALHYCGPALDLGIKISSSPVEMISKAGKKGMGNAYNNFGIIYKEEGNYRSALENHLKALKIREEINDKKGVAGSYNNIGEVYRNLDNFPMALENYLRSLKIKEEIGDKKGMANSNNNIGLVYYNMSRYPQALESHLQALKIYKEIGFKDGIGSSYFNIGIIYSAQEKFSPALENFINALAIFKGSGNKLGIANVHNNIGSIFYAQKNYAAALEDQFISLRMYEELNDQKGIASACVNIGASYGKQKQNAKAFEFVNKAITVAKRIGSKYNIKAAYRTLSDIYSANNDYENAYRCFQLFSAYQDSLMNEENSKQMGELKTNFAVEKKEAEMRSAQEKKDTIAETEKRKQRIIVWSVIIGLILMMGFAGFVFRSLRITGRQKLIIEQKNKELERLSIVASETENVILIMDAGGKLEWVNESFVRLNAITLEELKKLKGETIYEISNNPGIRAIIEKSVKEKKPVVYESKNKTLEGKVIWESSTLTPIFDASGKLKKLIIIDTDVTARKNAEEIIREKNKDITDSINYAKKIQQAILPDENEFQKYFWDSFVLFKPKDIVSGDFFWIAEKNDFIFYAAADCTGHGVPGGFMSMLGTSMLNEIINEKDILEPADILDLLRFKIIHALRQKGEAGENKDGMDMCLCRINKEKNELVYAAANNPLWLARKGQITEFPADKQPVGISGGEIKQFNERKIPLLKGDCIFAFTDGYADQFGGEKGKKFKYKQMQELLTANCDKPTKEQKRILDEAIEKWKSWPAADGSSRNLEQVDDILVIGIKV